MSLNRSTPVVSVIICTYNRSFWLRNCLESLVEQCRNANLVEVLIIDNNSSDDTRKVAEEYTSQLPNFRYFIEKTQGLSHGRNRGYWEAQGDLVAYIDDDARAHPDWVKSIIRFFEKHAQVTGVGGPYNAFSTVPIPDWFPKEYGRRSLGEETREIRDDEWISGTNMIFRKQALEEIGGFDMSLGMTGSKISYGEETNLVRRMQAKGMQIYYCPAIVVDHAILPYKLSLRWLLMSNYSSGKDGVKTFEYKGNAITYLPRLIRGMLRTLVIFVTCNEKYLKARIYRSVSQLLWQLGFFARLLE
jgi:glycosyltransferase involved in cell wall biosynthesis